MLKGQLIARQHQCDSLAKEFQAATLTPRQRASLAGRWDEALKASHALQLDLHLKERQQREGKVSR